MLKISSLFILLTSLPCCTFVCSYKSEDSLVTLALEMGIRYFYYQRSLFAPIKIPFAAYLGLVYGQLIHPICKFYSPFYYGFAVFVTEMAQI
jgi:hypothetical protein